MRRLFIQSCLALLCASSVVLAYDLPESRRAKYNFNPGWKLLVGDPAGAEAPDFDDVAWKDVTLPRAWNEDDAFKKAIDRPLDRRRWYRKHFRLPAGSRGQKGLPRVRGRPPGRRVLSQRQARRPPRERRDGLRLRRHRRTCVPRRRRTSSPCAPTTPGTTRRRRPARATSGTTATSTPTTAASTRTSRCTSTDRLYQTLPLYSNLGTTGVYVYAQRHRHPRRARRRSPPSRRSGTTATPRRGLHSTRSSCRGRERARRQDD